MSGKPDLRCYKSSPDAFNWNDQGAVTKVYNQGSLGTCWAFSAVQAVESQNFIKTKNLVSLSVEQLVECDGTSDSKTQ